MKNIYFQKGFTLLIFLIIITLLAAGVILFSSLIDKNSKFLLPFTDNGKEGIYMSLEKPKHNLIYTKAGTLSLYDFNKEAEVDFKLNPVTNYLWSSDGKLAVLVQGKYKGEQQSRLISEVYATTAGFLYSLYYVDVENKKSVEVLPEVFGAVRWSKDSLGYYVSEEYLKDTPMWIGEQSGLAPDRIDYFYVTLDGKKTKISKNEFESKSYIQNGYYSPDGKYYILNDYPFPYVISVESGKKYPLYLEDFYRSVERPKWSPDGKKIAYLYKTQGSEYYFRQVAYLDEVLKGYKYEGFADTVSESKYFDWIDENSLIETSFKYNNTKAFYEGDVFIIYLGEGKTEKILGDIKSKVAGEIVVSPDRRFFTIIEGKTYEDLEITIMNVDGGKVISLEGRDPSWVPYSK